MDIKLSDFKEYHKNPRQISSDRFDRLGDSLASLGDLGGVVVNRRTNEIIGGNQRMKSFLQEQDRYTIKVITTFPEPQKDGTVALGSIIKDAGQETEQVFSLRIVDWDEEKAERANIQANKVTGMWDYDILANQFDIDNLLDYGFTKQDLDMLPKAPEVKMDDEMLSKSMDSYLEGNIKQIVLFFKADQFDETVKRFDALMVDFGVDNHTEAVMRAVEFYEKNK
jgi:hypothetical protein